MLWVKDSSLSGTSQGNEYAITANTFNTITTAVGTAPDVSTAYAILEATPNLSASILIIFLVLRMLRSIINTFIPLLVRLRLNWKGIILGQKDGKRCPTSHSLKP